MVSSQAPAIPRLGVAAYGWWNEAAHGVAAETLPPAQPARAENTTSYPVDLSMAPTWDPHLMYHEAAPSRTRPARWCREHGWTSTSTPPP